MLAPVTPPEAVRDLFLSMGLGAWLCAGIVRRATGPLAALAAPVRQMAHNWRAAAGKMRADGKWRTARGKKHGPLPTKQLQKSARVLYNSE